MSKKSIVDKSFEQAVKHTGAKVDSGTASSIKEQALKAVSVASRIGTYLGDLNGDGKVDSNDLKVAAEKAGIAWKMVDKDLKTSLVAGTAAGVGTHILVGWIPFIGQGIATGAFVATTVYTFIVAKLSKLRSNAS